MSHIRLQPTDIHQTEGGEPAASFLPELPPQRKKDNYALHITLFILTFISTTYAGVAFVAPVQEINSFSDWLMLWPHGLPFGILLMLFLSAHEFGHYFAARAHGVDATLPYYIPMPFLFGTMGAVIRTRSQVPSRKAMFDIGVAGPLAGFVVAFAYLVIGMVTMPGIESLYAIHPEYQLMDTLPSYGMHFGGFLLYDALQAILVPSGAFFPGTNEMYHYPFIAVGWFGMFVTALNMIPVGQLDGGHVIYGMFGRKQQVISKWFVRFLMVVGIGGVAEILRSMINDGYAAVLPDFLLNGLGSALNWVHLHAGWWLQGWAGWLFWVFIIKVFIKVVHPPTPDEAPLDSRRKAIGWIALAILALTFSFVGIREEVPGQEIEPPAIEQGTSGTTI